MESSTQQIDRIMAIWNEHMEVSKALPISPRPSQTRLISSALLSLRAASYSSQGTGDRRPMRSTSPRNLRAASCASGNPFGPSRCTSTRRLSPQLEMITGMNMCLPASYPPMPGRAMCFWRSPQAAIAEISCARLRRLVEQSRSSSGSRVNRGGRCERHATFVYASPPNRRREFRKCTSRSATRSVSFWKRDWRRHETGSAEFRGGTRDRRAGF